MNRSYMRDKAMRRMGMDGRNPYGSRGGYVVSSRGRRGRDREMGNDYNYSERDRGYDYRSGRDERGQDNHYYGQPYRPEELMEYEMRGIGGIRPYEDYDMRGSNDYARGGGRGRGRDRDYGYGRGRGRDYGDYGYGRDYNLDYAMEEMEKEYKEELKEWTEKLKKKDRFNMPKEQIIQQAKQMGVRFEEFSEEEFYAVYLMMISDYKEMFNDPHQYLAMAKSWLMDDDIAVSPSEKLYNYLCYIVLGKED